MRRTLFLTICLLVLFHPVKQGYGQCTPDTSCHDTGGDPGQICPLSIPPGIVGEPYETVVTILPPASYTYNQTVFPVLRIEIDTIRNLPPGMTYLLSSSILYPDTLYCVLLQGTPTTPGTYSLKISVDAYLGISIPPYQFKYHQEDSTSIIFTVQQSSGAYTLPDARGTRILEVSPNPFSGRTRIGFYCERPAEAELKVYNLLGQVLYREFLSGIAGKNNFSYTAEDLPQGHYIYSITVNGKGYTGRMVKVRE